jgi:hypothetical protein
VVFWIVYGVELAGRRAFVRRTAQVLRVLVDYRPLDMLNWQAEGCSLIDAFVSFLFKLLWYLFSNGGDATEPRSRLKDADADVDSSTSATLNDWQAETSFRATTLMIATCLQMIITLPKSPSTIQILPK